MKFLLYSLFGGLLMLASIIGLYVISGTHGGHTFDIGQLSEMHKYMSSTTQNLLFLGFFIAFAIKAPLWPFHTWSPMGYAAAPTSVSMLHAGVLKKLGWDKDLTEAELAWIRGYFSTQVLPVLTPLAVGAGRPFPYISNLSLSLAVRVPWPSSSRIPATISRIPLVASAAPVGVWGANRS